MAKKEQKLILVTGATGHQGGAVFRHLRKRNFPVRLLTRNAEKPEVRGLVGKGVDVVQGNLDNPDSIRRALEDVQGVYSVQTLGDSIEAEIRQGIDLAEASNRSGVSHLVYSSVGSADRNTGIPHFDSKYRIEEHIRSIGIRYTILRPVFFMENWLGMRHMLEQGKLALPLTPETRLQMIAVDDIGAFATTAFEHPGHWEKRAVDIAGDELSMAELAQAFSRITGKTVAYEQVPWDRFEQQAGHEMTVMYRWFQNVGYNVDIAGLRQEHPSPINFDRWLNTTWTTTEARKVAGA